MELYIVIGAVAAGLLVILIVIVMLNRAWGDFPGRVSGLPPSMPPTISQPPAPMSSAPQMAEEPPMAGAPAGGLVPVSHPMVRRAVLAAMERGGSPYALYFIRDGEAVYLVPGRIADPQQRELVTRTFTSLHEGKAGGDLPIGDMMRVIQELGKK
jgi:hypothetical protein